MRFSPQFLDELRARLPVSEVVGKRVKLRKAGREWKGLSPFNKEKTPSFFVNDQKAMWFDFSSGKNGNIFDFVMQTDGVSFPEAVERLAGQAGVPMPVMTREAQAHEERRKTLHDIVEIAAKFFEANLASRAGARGRGYLADRGIPSATQLKFRLGYASAEQYTLKEHLGAAKISVEDMVEAGLLVAGDDIPVPYDRFRDRVMFPIADWRGRVIAFGGRALEKDVSAKYLNSPETPLFHKGATLYNIAAARQAAHNAGKPAQSAHENFSGRVIAVEGYIDVIAMVTAGYEATVAPLGTALTADQLALMWRMADEPILCFDGDDAGRRAAYRTLDLALPLIKPGKSLKLAALPDGQDPDDLMRSGGREAVEDVLSAAQPLVDVLWAREIEAGSFATPERRAALEARLVEVTDTVADETVRRYYRADFAARLRQLFAPADIATRRRTWNERARGGTSGARKLPPRAAFGRDEGNMAASPELAAGPLHRGHRTAIPRREALILQAALNHPWLLHDRLEELAEAEFRNADTRKLKTALIDVLAHQFGQEPERGSHQGSDQGSRQETGHEGDLDRVELLAALKRQGFAVLLGRIERSITTPSVWGARQEAAAGDVLLTWKQLLALHRQWHSLTRELKDAEMALGQDNSEANYTRLRDVKFRLSSLDGTEALVEGFGDESGRPARAL
jgi:DNA primase